MDKNKFKNDQNVNISLDSFFKVILLIVMKKLHKFRGTLEWSLLNNFKELILRNVSLDEYA